jgi:hypothetical protein
LWSDLMVLGPDGEPLDDGDSNDGGLPLDKVTPESVGLPELTQSELMEVLKRVESFTSSPDGHLFGATIVVAHQLFAWARTCLDERNISGPVAKVFTQAVMASLFDETGKPLPFHGEQLYKTIQNFILPSIISETMRRQRMAMAGAEAPDDFRSAAYRFPLPFDSLNAKTGGGLARGSSLILSGTSEPISYTIDTILRNFSATQHRLSLLSCESSAEAIRSQVWARDNAEVFVWDSWCKLMNKGTAWESFCDRLDGTDILIIECLEDLSDLLPPDEIYRKVISWCRSQGPQVALVIGTRQPDLGNKVMYSITAPVQFQPHPIDSQVQMRALTVGEDTILAYPEHIFDYEDDDHDEEVPPPQET